MNQKEGAVKSFTFMSSPFTALALIILHCHKALAVGQGERKMGVKQKSNGQQGLSCSLNACRVFYLLNKDNNLKPSFYSSVHLLDTVFHSFFLS